MLMVRIVGKMSQVMRYLNWLSKFKTFGEARRAYDRWWGTVETEEELRMMLRLTGRGYE